MKTPTARLLLFAMLLGFGREARSATIVYALTSNSFLYHSADGARTWQPIQITGAPVPAASPAFAVDPQNSSILYVALENGDKVPQPVHDIFRSADGGATWSQSNQPSQVGNSLPRLAVDPTSSKIVPGIGRRAPSGGFFRSADSAATWSVATLVESIPGIGTDARQPGVVYASTNSGKVIEPPILGLPGRCSRAIQDSQMKIYDITVNPNNSNVLYAPAEGSCLTTSKPVAV